MTTDVRSVQALFPDFESIAPFGKEGAQKILFLVSWRGRAALLKLYRKERAREQRSDREFFVYSKLQSPYVPRVYECGQVRIGDQPYAYLVEQYIEGESLRDRLDRQPIQPFYFVLKLAEALLRAATDFEKAGIVHRDIKPENILIDPIEHIWIIDFGVVRVLDMPSITVSGLYRGVGTPGYAAPEQFRNIKDAIDARADLFSIGVVLYECLAGSNPYLEPWPNLLEIIRRMENEDLPPLDLAEDPQGLFNRFIHELTARNPNQRPARAAIALKKFIAIRSLLHTHLG